MADLGLVSSKGSAPVLLKVMVVGAFLIVVVLGILSAWVLLEGGQVEELDALTLTEDGSVKRACMLGNHPLRQILT